MTNLHPMAFSLEELTLLRRTAYNAYACATQVTHLSDAHVADMMHWQAMYLRINDTHLSMAHADADLPASIRAAADRAANAAHAATAAFEVQTDYYEFAHGKKPKGRGYWAFEFREAGGWSEPFFVSGNKLYSEAKREAQVEGMRRGAHYARAAS